MLWQVICCYFSSAAFLILSLRFENISLLQILLLPSDVMKLTQLFLFDTFILMDQI